MSLRVWWLSCRHGHDGFAGTAVGDGAAEDVYQVVSLWRRILFCGEKFADGDWGTKRLNAKVKPRDVVVNDLEKDLSDGVSS